MGEKGGKKKEKRGKSKRKQITEEMKRVEIECKKAREEWKEKKEEQMEEYELQFAELCGVERAIMGVSGSGVGIGSKLDLLSESSSKALHIIDVLHHFISINRLNLSPLPDSPSRIRHLIMLSDLLSTTNLSSTLHDKTKVVIVERVYMYQHYI